MAKASNTPVVENAPVEAPKQEQAAIAGTAPGPRVVETAGTVEIGGIKVTHR